MLHGWHRNFGKAIQKKGDLARAHIPNRGLEACKVATKSQSDVNGSTHDPVERSRGPRPRADGSSAPAFALAAIGLELSGKNSLQRTLLWGSRGRDLLRHLKEPLGVHQ